MSKKAAYGTRLRYQSVSDPTTNAIHFVADISGPEMAVETIDVSTHDSPDHFTEFLPGMADGGEVSFDLMFDSDDGGHDRILELVEERALIDFTLFLPQPTTNFVSDPTFDTGTGWTAGTGWTLGGVLAAFGSGSASAGAELSVNLTGLAVGEAYAISIVSEAGTGAFDLYYGAVLLQSFVATAAHDTTVRFTALAETATIKVKVPATTAAAFNLLSLQVSGFTEAADERFDFTGLFTKAGVTAPVKGALQAAVGIKVSGAPVFTPAA